MGKWLPGLAKMISKEIGLSPIACPGRSVVVVQKQVFHSEHPGLASLPIRVVKDVAASKWH